LFTIVSFSNKKLGKVDGEKQKLQQKEIYLLMLTFKDEWDNKVLTHNLFRMREDSNLIDSLTNINTNDTLPRFTTDTTIVVNLYIYTQ
jgi:hypothetical protein